MEKRSARKKNPLCQLSNPEAGVDEAEAGAAGADIADAVLLLLLHATEGMLRHPVLMARRLWKSSPTMLIHHQRRKARHLLSISKSIQVLRRLLSLRLEI
jgi:hypothetical protein